MAIVTRTIMGRSVTGVLATLILAVPLSGVVRAHCDSLDGPVIIEARAALEAGDVTPVLKWVDRRHEAEIRSVFEHVMRVRRLSDDALPLADRFFFETLVRVHRTAEGAPYSGLKPAGSDLYAVETAADKALASGSIDALASKIAERAGEGVRERFARAVSAKQHADESVEAGREYVSAYVEYVHYVLGVHDAIEASEVHHHGATVQAPAQGEHDH